MSALDVIGFVLAGFILGVIVGAHLLVWAIERGWTVYRKGVGCMKIPGKRKNPKQARKELREKRGA
jgi:hypothetical protein